MRAETSATGDDALVERGDVGEPTSRTTAESVTNIVTLVVVLLAIGVTAWRIFYGVDFIDESLYAAESYRFALGARPFMDLIDTHQLASLLVAPYVWLHVRLFGDTTGIMLSLRVLWLVMDAITTYVWYRLLSGMMDRRLAMLACVVSFSFIPYMIPAPSFNTLPVFFESSALALICFALTGRLKAWVLALAGVLLGVATFAYPTLVVAALFAVAGVWWLTRSWRQPLLVAGGGALVAVVGALALLPFASGVPALLEQSRAAAPLYGWLGAGGIWGKVGHLALREAEWGAKHLSLYLAAVAAVVSRIRRSVPWWLPVAVVASLPLATPAVVAFYDVRTLIIATSIMVAAAIVLVGRREPLERFGEGYRPLVFALMFGLVAGVVFAFTSSQGFVFFGLGAIMAMPAALALLLGWLVEEVGRSDRQVLALPAAALAIACLAVGLMYYNGTGYYRDAPPAGLPVRVSVGPHAGLMTTEYNASATEGLWKAMRKHAGPGERLLSYHGFPAGHLYTAAAPSLQDLWIQPFDALGIPSVTANQLTRLNDSAHRPTVIIRNLGLPSAWVFLDQNPSKYDPKYDGIEAFVEKGYRVESEGDGWQVLVPKR